MSHSLEAEELVVEMVHDCTWTWNCTPPPLGCDIHPNNDGYGVIAQAFAVAVAS